MSFLILKLLVSLIGSQIQFYRLYGWDKIEYLFQDKVIHIILSHVTMSDDHNWHTVKSRQRKPKDVFRANTPKTNEPKTNESKTPEEYVSEWDKVTILTKSNASRVVGTKPRTTKPNTYQGDTNFRKLDEADSADALPKVDMSIGSLLQRVRAEQKLSQSQLVTKIGGRAKVTLRDIQDIEKGVAFQNNAKVAAIENSLNIHLRGKKVGQPMRPPKKVTTKNET